MVRCEQSFGVSGLSFVCLCATAWRYRDKRRESQVLRKYDGLSIPSLAILLTALVSCPCLVSERNKLRWYLRGF